MNMYIPSVNAAANMIYRAYMEENFDRLREIQEYLDNSEVARRVAGSADEFHNASVTLARIGFYDYAFSLLVIAHLRYPRDADILADLLAYGLKCRELSELSSYEEKLKQIDKGLWTWRAFNFLFDFLMEKLRYSDGENSKRLSTDIEQLIMDYKANSEHFSDQSDREKAYMVEYEYYIFKRDVKKAIGALKDATSVLKNKCAQCALKLADYHFERGEYSETVKYAEQAVNIKEDQASIRVGYAYYILAMSRENIVRTNGESMSEAKIKPVFNAYSAAVTFMRGEDGRDHLLTSIKNQVMNLEYDSGIQSRIDFGN